MNLNLSNILLRTNKGLDVYQYILDQHFKGETLCLQDNLCHAVRNPFNNGRRTMIVELRDHTAGHWDLEQKAFGGEMIEFAKLHFQTTTRPELYYMINQALELGLKAHPFQTGGNSDRDPSWEPKVSFFQPPISNTLPCDTLNLAQIANKLDGGEFREITARLRSIRDPKQARAYKATHFPYVTFGGCFTRRNDKELVQDSELMVFDFDDLQDLKTVSNLLLEDEYFDTELLFTSPTGNGLKWVIRHKTEITPDRGKFFKGVSSYLKSKYNLTVDKSGSDHSRACFLGHDPEIFLNARHWEAWVEENLEAMKSKWESEDHRPNSEEKISA